MLFPGDLVVDGGHSSWADDEKHAKDLGKRGFDFVDAGVSGGVWGLKNGYALMVGGDKATVDDIKPVFDALKPDGPYGHVHAGRIGAGHFSKMVHNGIEYAMMQAYAEGWELLEKVDSVDNAREIFRSWQEGTATRSWLLELAVNALDQDHQLDNLRGWAADSGEGRWTVEAAIDNAAPLPAITASLFARFASRQDDSPHMKMIAALRNQFGGHAVEEVGPDGRPPAGPTRRDSWTVSRRHTSSTDVPLTVRGEEQARDVTPLLAGSPIATAFVSPLSRALRTAELAGLVGAEIMPELHVILASRIPESPHYLVSSGRLAEAGAAVRDIEGPVADEETRIAEISRALRNTHKPRIRDHFNGRAGLLLVSTAVSLGLAAWAFSYKTGTGDDIGIPDTQGTLALVAAHAFVFFAASGGVVLWVLVGEMFPLRIRAAAISVATAFDWVANWAVTESFPPMPEWNLSASYSIYAAFAALSAVFVAAVVKETKGTRLGEID